MYEAVLYEKLNKGNVKCGVCQRRCVIAKGKRGVCQNRQNLDGKLYLLTYGRPANFQIDSIEKKPLYHFFPGTACFSIGGFGCNFRCPHCCNFFSTWGAPELKDENLKEFMAQLEIRPAELIEKVKASGCPGLAFTYNEPAIWLEYTLDCFKIAKREGLYTVYVTNGFITPEALELLKGYLDAFRVDIKSMEDGFYQKICGVPSGKGVREVTVLAKDLGMHIECVTNIIPTLNDDLKMLESLAHWIKTNLGSKTPWHISRFSPNYNGLRNVPPTPTEMLKNAYQIGKDAGLEFVYVWGTSEPSEKFFAIGDTVCPRCGKLVVKRPLWQTEVVGVDENGRCKFCDEDLNIRRRRAENGRQI